ncbi:hypothetical protein AK830_g9964 [Neonectria ditissima]|uniref:Uncharacterized protein n=1 Tax=Neonectria ditissima TaxID=78410 RepID=A0A0P7B4K2_9HYPO|nr:hypothetical protein AK830_g9964 [Neonectria ditissima]
MGIVFSHPGKDTFPPGAYAAGATASINGSTITPYLGINSGLYGDIPTKDLPPIPFEWMISPSEITDTCPNASQILAMFAVTEAIIVLLTPVIAYRPAIHFLSRGWLGKRRKGSVALTWTIVFTCQLLANAIIAGMVGNTPGYGHLNMLRLFTVYMARPRFHIVVLGLLRSIVGVERGRDMDKTRIIDKRIDERVEFPYTDAYMTAGVSEMLMLIIGAIFTSVTWRRVPSASVAREYTSDIVSFVSSAPAVMLLCIFAFVPVYKRYGEAFPIEGRRYETARRWGVSVTTDGQASLRVRKTKRKASMAKKVASAAAAAVFMGFVTLVQFTYWARFLELPGVLFCPPKMIESGVVWTVFTIVGTVAGAAS